MPVAARPAAFDVELDVAAVAGHSVLLTGYRQLDITDAAGWAPAFRAANIA